MGYTNLGFSTKVNCHMGVAFVPGKVSHNCWSAGSGPSNLRKQLAPDIFPIKDDGELMEGRGGL